MAECERRAGCPMVNGSGKTPPAEIEMIVRAFCTADYSACARYMVLKALGGEFVPLDLQPRQADRAREIIRDNQDLL